MGKALRRLPREGAPTTDYERGVARQRRYVDQSIVEAIEEGISMERLARVMALPISALEERVERQRHRRRLRVVKDETS